MKRKAVDLLPLRTHKQKQLEKPEQEAVRPASFRIRSSSFTLASSEESHMEPILGEVCRMLSHVGPAGVSERHSGQLHGVNAPEKSPPPRVLIQLTRLLHYVLNFDSPLSPGTEATRKVLVQGLLIFQKNQAGTHVLARFAQLR